MFWRDFFKAHCDFSVLGLKLNNFNISTNILNIFCFVEIFNDFCRVLIFVEFLIFVKKINFCRDLLNKKNPRNFIDIFNYFSLKFARALKAFKSSILFTAKPTSCNFHFSRVIKSSRRRFKKQQRRK